MSIPLIYFIYEFFYLTIRHKKRMSKIDQWGDFNREIIDLVDEISDPKIQIEFMDYCMKIATKDTTDIYIFSVNDERKKIARIFGKHIPSIMIEQRDKKIIDILS